MASPLRLLLAITLLGSGCGGDDDRRAARWTCGPCRFRSEDVGLGDIVAAPDGSIHLAFFGDAGLVYARVGEAGLERETIGAPFAIRRSPHSTTSPPSCRWPWSPTGSPHLAYYANAALLRGRLGAHGDGRG